MPSAKPFTSKSLNPLSLPAGRAGEGSAKPFTSKTSPPGPLSHRGKAGEGVGLQIRRLGLIDYAGAVALQEDLVRDRISGSIPDTLLLLEHPPVITQGTGTHSENLLTSESGLIAAGIALHSTNRGGDITYHGPGQLISYPILNLLDHQPDVHWYVRSLEEVLIRLLAAYNLPGERVAGRTGVWVRGKKIAAIGVHVKRWVTSHGFALNVHPDLAHFGHIIPCGIADAGVTSMAACGVGAEMGDVMSQVVGHFQQVFGFARTDQVREKADADLNLQTAFHST